MYVCMYIYFSLTKTLKFMYTTNNYMYVLYLHYIILFIEKKGIWIRTYIHTYTHTHTYIAPI